jgi:hypothetical protein
MHRRSKVVLLTRGEHELKSRELLALHNNALDTRNLTSMIAAATRIAVF